MFKWMNGYTLLTLVLSFIFLLNTLLRVLLNSDLTIFVWLGVALVCCFLWFIVINVSRCIKQIAKFVKDNYL